MSLVGNSDPVLHSAGTAAPHAADQQNKSRATAAKAQNWTLFVYVSVYGGWNVWWRCETMNPPTASKWKSVDLFLKLSV